jgi:hypothetical protein
MDQVYLLFAIMLVAIAAAYMIIVYRKPVKETTIDQGPFDRARRKAGIYAQTHKAGTPVVAQSKDGSWKDGVIIGEHDWALFTFFFTIRFNDGEIIKQEETKVTVVKVVEPKKTT